MPRNACRECRSRKIKCLIPRAGEACERCTARNIPCSNVHPTGRPDGSGVLRGQQHQFTGDYLGRSFPYDMTAMRPRRRKAPHSSFVALGDELDEVLLAYDIGQGTPSEILREGELSKELLILYFANFSDIHFMFDEERFLRGFDLGEMPKSVLYAMMALGIRYSDSSIFEGTSRSHRGESLYKGARKELVEEFDHLSLTNIQVYILLRMASNMVKTLRLMENPVEGDTALVDHCRRAFCTIVLMDRTLSPSLNLPCFFSLEQHFKEPIAQRDLQSIGSVSSNATESLGHQSSDLTTIIFRLSRLFCKMCLHHRQPSHEEDIGNLEQEFLRWSDTTQGSLLYSENNFAMHHIRGTLRQFLYLHLLYHHIGQLLFFPSLRMGGPTPSQAGDLNSRILQCYYHADRITEIVDYCWRMAGFDVHNVSVGQILTVAAAVHMHSCLTAGSRDRRDVRQVNITIINDYLSRVRKHVRIFDRISAQLDTFFEICGRSSTSRHVYDSNKRLLRHILHYGTAFERLDHRKTGHIDKLAESSNNSAGDTREPSPSFQPPQEWDTLMSTSEPMDDMFQNCAWMFSDSSLNDLYSMPYSDPASSMLLDYQMA